MSPTIGGAKRPGVVLIGNDPDFFSTWGQRLNGAKIRWHSIFATRIKT